MESVNISPKEFRKNLWHVCAAITVLIIAFRLPDLIQVL